MEECPVCFEDFDDNVHNGCIIPCKEGHTICLACLIKLLDRSNKPASECCLNNNCDPTRRHFRCPTCRDVTHLRNNNVNEVLRLPNDQAGVDEIISRRRKLIREIRPRSNDLNKLGENTITHLEIVKTKLDKDAKNIRIAKVVGGSTGFIGSALFIVGAALAIPSFGASSALMVVGAAIGVSGGATAGGAGIADIIKTKKAVKKTKELCDLCQARYFELFELLHEFHLINSLVNIRQFMAGAYTFSLTAGTAGGIIRLGVIAADASVDTIAGIFRTARALGQGLHIAGIAFSGVLAAMDIITIIWNSVELGRGDPADYSKKIDEAIENIQRICVDQESLFEDRHNFIEDSLRNNNV